MKKNTEHKNNKILCVSHKIKIRFDETDAMGIVWHGNYLKYFEDGREAFGRKFGISYQDVMDKNLATPIVKSSVEHFLSLKYGEECRVETTYIFTEAAKLVFSYRIFNTKKKLVCTGETVQVFTEIKNGEMQLSIPQFYKDWKQRNILKDA